MNKPGEGGRSPVMALVGAFCLGVGAGFLIQKIQAFRAQRAKRVILERRYSVEGHLVNPLLRVEVPPGNDPQVESARHSIEAFINDAIAKKDAERVSVYLKLLDKSDWMGVNEDDKFSAGSLEKIPVMLFCLRKAEQDPAILQTRITYEAAAKDGLVPDIAPKQSLQVGGAYSVDELLRDMIVYSDNASTYLLENALVGDADSPLVQQLFSDARIAAPREGREHFVSAEECGRYFRMLYSATYLNEAFSLKALQWLAESDFREGIVAGTPAGTVVAHKFAQRGEGLGRNQLHDCGIVYAPTGPYVLCVMTEGWDLKSLEGVIRQISALAYKHFTASGRE